MADFLSTIIEKKRARVTELLLSKSLEEMKDGAAEARAGRPPGAFRNAFTPDAPNIIAEFKRASPSLGVINDGRDPVESALAYKKGGAAAISVITEEDFFGGTLDDLRSIRAAVDLPLLRKDFIVNEFQIYESAAAGADAILLIAAALSPTQLTEYSDAARSLGIDALVEVHDAAELEIAANAGASIIGINNRDLRTFKVSLAVSRHLITHAPKDNVMIAESGIATADDIAELRALGFQGFLIGEILMRSGDPAATLMQLRGASQ
ncbi:MAG: indole-3-glycerol phosphate synthase TrpC [Blastocatellia bacterium]|nr:indole-3-glycerol phosphate synthase TrpC [Blastocatellia bacterium]